MLFIFTLLFVRRTKGSGGELVGGRHELRSDRIGDRVAENALSVIAAESMRQPITPRTAAS
jgi:hypothetical protein